MIRRLLKKTNSTDSLKQPSEDPNDLTGLMQLHKNELCLVEQLSLLVIYHCIKKENIDINSDITKLGYLMSDQSS